MSPEAARISRGMLTRPPSSRRQSSGALVISTAYINLRNTRQRQEPSVARTMWQDVRSPHQAALETAVDPQPTVDPQLTASSAHRSQASCPA